MTTLELGIELVEALRTKTMTGSFRREGDFECGFVVPTCLPILEAHKPKLDIARHADCAVQLNRDRKEAERIWAASKSWQNVHAWGMQHTFDFVARYEASDWSMAVEVKLAPVVGGRWPNGEFQRMAGQCLLARVRHKLVIGVMALRGAPDPQSELDFHPDRDRGYQPQEDFLNNHGIHIVVRGLG